MKKTKKIEDPIKQQALMASVDIYESSLVVSRYSSEGAVSRVFAEPHEVARLFSGEKRITQWFASEPSAIRLGIRSNGHRAAIVSRPAGPAEMEFHFGKKVRTIRACLPNLLAAVAGNDGGWTSIIWVAAYWGKLREGTSLYLPPLPNLTGHKCGVCMGEIKTKLFAKYDALTFFNKAFLGTRFSDHHADTCLKDKAKYRNVFELLRSCPETRLKSQLKKAGAYGEQWLQNIED